MFLWTNKKNIDIFWLKSLIQNSNVLCRTLEMMCNTKPLFQMIHMKCQDFVWKMLSAVVNGSLKVNNDNS